VFRELEEQRVALDGIVLKPSMVIPGARGPVATPAEVAMRTREVLRGCVPPDVPGIAFLSGGQSDDDATARLNAMNQMAGSAPWRLTFSFSRALLLAPLKVWAGRHENVPAAQHAFAERAHASSLASLGRLGLAHVDAGG
jgi:fructose-bisphosphate aldolase class I